MNCIFLQIGPNDAEYVDRGDDQFAADDSADGPATWCPRGLDSRRANPPGPNPSRRSGGFERRRQGGNSNYASSLNKTWQWKNTSEPNQWRGIYNLDARQLAESRHPRLDRRRLSVPTASQHSTS